MYSSIRKNKVKTILIMVVFILLISALGGVFAAALETPGFFIFTLIFAISYAAIGYFTSAKMAIAMTGAKPVTKAEAPRLYRIVENLSITAGMPMPKVYIVDDPAPNAFATGRNPENGVVAATTGILELLDDTELEGVMAHEMSHVQNYDIRVTSIVIALVTVVAFLSDFLMRIGLFGGVGDRDRGGAMLAISIVASIIAPLVAMMLQLAVSRKREFLADASGALLTRYPEGLASALQKIETTARPMRKANNATAHLFLSNPFGRNGKQGQFMRKLFSTHPPTSERVAQLEKMKTSL